MGDSYNPLPNIECYEHPFNPIISSPSSTYQIGFLSTRESLTDVDQYRSFLKNVEKRVRSSKAYTGYKSFLMGLGLDHCQIHGYINSEMATLEMHHTILTLFDICLMVTEHLLNQYGGCTTFDVVQIVKDEHKLHHVAITMLSKTPHQIYHSESGFFIHPDMCIGDWVTFMTTYIDGMTQDLAFKLLYYIKRSIDVGVTDDSGLLNLRDQILDWSGKNVL